MPEKEHKFGLPPKIDSYLATLNRHYKSKNEPILREVVVNGTVSVHEGWDYDNWNGGTYGHAITLKVPEELFLRLVDKKDDVRKRIAEDLNKLNSIQDEHVSEVFIETESVDNENWREQSGVFRPRLDARTIAPEDLDRIWGDGHVRVFLSHKSSVKEETSRLKKSLAKCGISSFVAHEDIEATEEWQREIDRALFSMDALIALLTEDYHDSNWTDQEVGVAIGRGVNLIAVRLGIDPYGLMGKAQGLGGCSWDDTDSMAGKLFQVLHKCMVDKSRLLECALSAYKDSTSWADSAWKVENVLSVFDTLTEDQFERLRQAYRANPQNRDSLRGSSLLRPLLERWTGSKWSYRGNTLVRIKV